MTRLRVTAAGPRVRVDSSGGPLAVRTLAADAASARVAFVATQALLLAGDHVEVVVEVGPGITLDILEVAGTVAYDAAGAGSSWSIRASVGESGWLIWRGEPFVVASGANVTRCSEVALAAGATAVIRETLVLGRSGEVGGALINRIRVTYAGTPLLAEDLDLSAAADRCRPGLLGAARVVDAAMFLGERAPDRPRVPVGHRFDLAGPGTLARVLRSDLAGSPVQAWFSAWVGPIRPGGAAR